jgi:hypothetical protein
MTADGFARIIPISLGAVRMRACAVAPGCLAPTCNPSDEDTPPRMPPGYDDDDDVTRH